MCECVGVIRQGEFIMLPERHLQVIHNYHPHLIGGRSIEVDSR